MKSNCLFEAIKAKLKDPKNVRILYWTPKMNNGHWHFLWYNLKDNTVTHYNVKDDMKIRLFFNGKYKTVSFDTYEAWMLDTHKYDYKKLIKIAKRQNFKSLNIQGINFIDSKKSWPSEKDIKYLRKILRENISIKVKYLNKEKIVNLDKLPVEKNFYWKYFTPYDKDFIEMNGLCLNVDSSELF